MEIDRLGPEYDRLVRMLSKNITPEKRNLILQKLIQLNNNLLDNSCLSRPKMSREKKKVQEENKNLPYPTAYLPIPWDRPVSSNNMKTEKERSTSQETYDSHLDKKLNKIKIIQRKILESSKG